MLHHGRRRKRHMVDSRHPKQILTSIKSLKLYCAISVTAYNPQHSKKSYFQWHPYKEPHTEARRTSFARRVVAGVIFEALARGPLYGDGARRIFCFAPRAIGGGRALVVEAFPAMNSTHNVTETTKRSFATCTSLIVITLFF